MNPETTWSSAEHNKRLKRLLENGQPAVAAKPRHVKGEKLGVLEVINKTGKAHYTEEDLTILETLASQAAIAIQNSCLVSFELFFRARSHGGRIWVESVEGKGSNFTFILPVNPGQADTASRVFIP